MLVEDISILDDTYRVDIAISPRGNTVVAVYAYHEAWVAVPLEQVDMSEVTKHVDRYVHFNELDIEVKRWAIQK